MRSLFPVALIFISTTILLAQEEHFGKVGFSDFKTSTYPLDTGANAIVLAEYGEAHVDNGGEHNLMVHYFVRIKILKAKGLAEADYKIYLYKNERGSETINTVKASSYNFEKGGIVETKLSRKQVFREDLSKHTAVTKFAIPNVKVGSIIEIFYVKESPFLYNFHGWEFQSNIPKLFSQYEAEIPGNYVYNITLKGYLKLSTNENEIVKECFSPGGNAKADCSSFTWAMKNIPAFVEEKFMTAPSNHISSINFELSELRYFDGRVDKITKEWKDAESELRHEERFGVQLKKGKDVLETEIAVILASEKDELKRMQKIFDMVRHSYTWTGKMGMFSDNGIKKAFTSKSGNVADINLTLIAALKYAGISTDPVILSTRDNGLPIDIHPVISDFNYVVARAKVNNKFYLLDATDDLVSPGMLPVRCLNGKGRVLGEDGSSFIELAPGAKDKTQAVYTLNVKDDGTYDGTLQMTYHGYAALEKRGEIYRSNDVDAYIAEFRNKSRNFRVLDMKIENLDSIHLPLLETIRIVGEEASSGRGMLINPFLLDKWSVNPFVAPDRIYPVDFGVPIDESVMFTLNYPAGMMPTDLPSPVAKTLPGNGGRLLYDVKEMANTVNVAFSFNISKSLYNAAEYPYLRELFGMLVQVQSTDIYITKQP